MQLVILAAGHGRRFGGLKQLAPVGPNGEAIMDYTARSAQACGYEGIVLVVREDIRDEIVRHVRRSWPSSLAVEFTCQPPTPGTAQAVLAARPALGDVFGVANADDLYGDHALEILNAHLRDRRRGGTEVAGVRESDRQAVPGTAGGAGRPGRASPHVLVAYHLVRTVLTAAAVTRGLCEVSQDGELDRIVEHRVELAEDGSFSATPLDDEGDRRSLSGDELVSMNLWGFEARMLDHLDEALQAFVPRVHGRRELLLPDVVGTLVTTGKDTVAVVETSSKCIGVTHQEDLALVQDELAGANRGGIAVVRPGL